MLFDSLTVNSLCFHSLIIHVRSYDNFIYLQASTSGCSCCCLQPTSDAPTTPLSVAGILFIVGPIVFYINYQSSSDLFYYSDSHTYAYGPGYALTVVAGVALLISSGQGAVLFCCMVTKLLRKHMNPPVSQRLADIVYPLIPST